MSASVSPLDAPTPSVPATPPAALDRAIARVREKSRQFARLAPSEKAGLLRECITRLEQVAEAWAAAGCRAKSLEVNAPVAAEEWLLGPVIVARNLRLLVGALDDIAETGKPRVGADARQNAHGQLEVEVFPRSTLESAVFLGFSAYHLMQAGTTRANLRSHQALFYDRQRPEGSVSAILGAGNLGAIPATDMLYKLFVEGTVVVLKINPVNEWVGPFLERAFEPLISRDYLQIVYGGGDVGSYLVEHQGVDTVHITGSQQTHDLIVWGPAGPLRERRLRDNDPQLKKPISSELGNVTPVAIVPARYTNDELWFQARSVASMVTNNASFNCIAAKLLILAKGWPQRDQFMALLGRALENIATREAYYPGAVERYRTLTADMPRIEKFGEASASKLPWTLIRDVDANNVDHKLFRTEPFCAILSQTEIGSAVPAEFLRELVPFANNHVWGTLSAVIVMPLGLEKDPEFKLELERALRDLRYGTVSLNHWPGLAYGLMSPAWGGHPSSTLRDIQSGMGWVHNTGMFEAIEKTVLRGPLVAFPKPVWFADHARSLPSARQLLRFFSNPSVSRLPALAFEALRG
jgi:acyl-CoA reductase-like NAD-dependent aldehyde dehydrogenase